MEELNLSSLSTEVQLSPDSKNINIDDLRGVRAALIEDIDLEIQAAAVNRNEKDANEPNQGTPTGSFENTPSSLKNGDTFDLEDYYSQVGVRSRRLKITGEGAIIFRFSTWI